MEWIFTQVMTLTVVYGGVVFVDVHVLGRVGGENAQVGAGKGITDIKRVWQSLKVGWIQHVDI